MAKPPAPAATAPSYSLRASVPIASGACGWRGSDVPAGETLTTADPDVFARLVDLGYGIAEGTAAEGTADPAPTSTRP